MRQKRISFRGLDGGLLAQMTEIVKKYNDGKARGKEGSFVAADINHLMKLYIMTEGTICHSENLARKKNIIKNALHKLDAMSQEDLDGYVTEDKVKRVVAQECVDNDRIDPRTINNYQKITMQLLDPNPDDLVLYSVPAAAHNQFI
jgi:hypothetical protein